MKLFRTAPSPLWVGIYTVGVMAAATVALWLGLAWIEKTDRMAPILVVLAAGLAMSAPFVTKGVIHLVYPNRQSRWRRPDGSYGYGTLPTKGCIAFIVIGLVFYAGAVAGALAAASAWR